MDVSKTGASENTDDASSDSEVAQFYRPGLCHFVVLTDIWHFTSAYNSVFFLALDWVECWHPFRYVES